MYKGYSEDYQLLLAYKANPCKEMSRYASRFFFAKYKETTIDFYANRYLESVGIISEKERYHFLAVVRYKYIPQALRSFNPDKIIKKENYEFSKYFYLYLRHAERDFRNRALKEIALTRAASTSQASDPEEQLLERERLETEKKILEHVKKYLSPLQFGIFYLQTKGKKQCEMEIINPATEKKYSKGYISKEVAKLKKIIDSLNLRAYI